MAGKRKVIQHEDSDKRMQASDNSDSEAELTTAPVKTMAQWEALVDEEVNATLPELLHQYIGTAKKHRHDLLKHAFEGTTTVCNLAALVKENGNDTQLETLKDLTANYIQMQGEINTYEDKLVALDHNVLAKRIPKTFNGILDTSNAPTVDVSRHEYYKKFCAAAGIEADEDEDADVLVQETETLQSLLCPITQMEMTEPVQNRACGHTYSKNGIVAHLRRKNGCPIAGCREKVTMDSLERNVEMEVLIARKQQRIQLETQNTTAMDSDDDDEIPEHNVE
ncbi:hypothetical protein THRCLA_11278 [Thraustotheca clavata]|uniref:SP-RING-type domain-containing protein n=1 Tax=Thraustotheca clavata TaxID=74557 RepID=A0A1V9Y873_9STRA|nr:hypothetical protein THRCLA_11278 [Thraustotheca clavata]